MDTTETNIKMCEKAEEIQPNFKTLVPDACRIYIDKGGNWWCQKGFLSTDWTTIWLPRQDQLQEMVNYSNIQQLISDFNDFVHYYDGELGFYTARFNNSMEQLWLAFVMKEKFNKTWDGEKWVGELTHKQD